MDYGRQPDPDLASELRQGAGREWKEEAAEDERRGLDRKADRALARQGDAGLQLRDIITLEEIVAQRQKPEVFGGIVVGS